MSDDLAAFIANLTNDCGVYRMLDAQNTVLYVGKATQLKKRVSSYFNKPASSAKTKALVAHIVAIEVSVTRTETEALLLESRLIKSLRPKYNVLLRDDKSYPFIYISDGDYPRIEIVRHKKKPQNGAFYGPYPSVAAVREALTTIQKIFNIRTCRDSFFNNRARPCLQYQIKRCTAPCTGYISALDYQQAVRDAANFLAGKNQLILDELAQRMEQAVGRLDFEVAAQLRDQIKRLRLVQEQQGMVQQQGEADVIVLQVSPGFAAVQCVSIRDGDVIASQRFFPSVPQTLLISDEEQVEQALRQHVLDAFVAFYYLDTPQRIPPLLILAEASADVTVLADLLTQLRGSRCRVQVKPRGNKARWLAFAQDNLQLAINEHLASKATITQRYHALKTLLQQEHDITRIECFDISHTQGDLTVASCVVFDQDGPRKKDYKRFNITGITPGDDYAAMEQALMRRFKHGSLQADQPWSYPDVLLIDGGKGQIAVARLVLQQLNIVNVRLLGIVKDSTRKAEFDRLMIDDNTELSVPADSPALHLLQYLRDEAHRFAITTHRKKRQKAMLDSSLETLKGVGPKRRKALLQRFGGLRELAKAPVEEIAKVAGISQALAMRIFAHFHG